MTDSPSVLVGKVFGIAASVHAGQYRRDGIPVLLMIF